MGFRDDCKALAKIGKVRDIAVVEMLGASVSRVHTKRRELEIALKISRPSRL
jgi:hypothetical protein